MKETLYIEKPVLQYFKEITEGKYSQEELLMGKKVYVYYNFHKSCWSIKDYQTGKVIAHSDSVKLENVEFRVRQGGRNRVIQDKRKNVHAFVIGNITSVNKDHRSLSKGAMYQPYKYSSFMDVKAETPIYKAKTAYLSSKRKVSYSE